MTKSSSIHHLIRWSMAVLSYESICTAQQRQGSGGGNGKNWKYGKCKGLIPYIYVGWRQSSRRKPHVIFFTWASNSCHCRWTSAAEKGCGWVPAKIHPRCLEENKHLVSLLLCVTVHAFCVQSWVTLGGKIMLGPHMQLRAQEGLSCNSVRAGIFGLFHTQMKCVNGATAISLHVFCSVCPERSAEIFVDFHIILGGIDRLYR